MGFCSASSKSFACVGRHGGGQLPDVEIAVDKQRAGAGGGDHQGRQIGADRGLAFVGTEDTTPMTLAP